MRHALLTLGLICTATAAAASLVEVPPNDYLVINPAAFGAGDPLVADVVQCATAPHPVADRVLLVWTFDYGTGPIDVVAGVLDPNQPIGEALVIIDDVGARVRDPAAAYDEGSGRWLIVWAQEHAPGAWEIYGRLMYPDGSLSPAPVRITTTGVNDLDPRFDALQPAVASDDAGTFLVVWAADDDAAGTADGQFRIAHRTVNAQSGALGAVGALSAPGPGLAALAPDVGYFKATNQWFVVWEEDQVADAAVYAPTIYGNFVPGPGGAPRQAGQAFALAPAGANRRVAQADRNPAIAIDPLRQEMGITWNTLPSGAAAERLLFGGVWSDTVGLLNYAYFGDLDLAGYAPQAWVRDPDVTHSRISDSFVFGWRESLNPDGSGQTLKAAEFNVLAGVLTPAFRFVEAVAGEFGPPAIEGGWRNNGRTLAIWNSDSGVPGYLQNYGQGFDLAAVTDAPAPMVPARFAVRVAPNPFNPRTSIELSLPVAGRARVDIYDIRGRLVRRLVDEDLAAGNWSRTWEGIDDGGRRVASGVYLVEVRHPAGRQVSKVALVE